MKFDEIKKHLSRFSIGIAGAGGLGSNCAVALTRSGIGRLIIADYDFVEETNLNRQYFFSDQVGMKKTDALMENLRRINPATRAEMHDIRLNPDNIPFTFRDCDLIIEALDSSAMKEMLAETVMDTWPDRPIIFGSGLAGYGKNNDLRERVFSSTVIVCGDGKTESSDDLPPMAPRVAIVAAMQANAAIEILMKMDKNEDKA
jgi:sulfur carrier protein ThiS adenylyltransferase